MIGKIIFGFIVFIIAVSMSQCIGSDPVITVKDIPVTQEGMTVRGQTTWTVDSTGAPIECVGVAIDDDVIDDPDCAAVIAHEMGHAGHPDWDEAACDDFAFQVTGIVITDAFHGIH